ncbi:MAG TPA: cysteine--tRNA ligase [Opitutales bacterium]|nr:cysteine--tRNA ligase [Opitutales bacterium]
MPLRLHNTLTRAVETIVPGAPDGIFRMYCCGPTVYGPAHIGNFRTFVIQDVLRRALEIELGHGKIRHARNITDVDDKTIRQSLAEGKSLADFTKIWTEKFHADCQALNLLPPQVEPGAVEHLPGQIALIERLVQNGHAYRADDGSVYFKVASFPQYGALSHLKLEELESQHDNSAGALNQADEYTREHVADFALWKARKPEDGPNFWPSPWGEGRPGWHIECSAMIEKVFDGRTIDLHGGGVDLMFPHHENEIAQSCCAHDGDAGYHFARHWFHSAHLLVDGRKMSKSLGNLYTLEDLEKKGFSATDLRFALISGHYRSTFNFTLHGLDAAKSAVHKLDKHLQAFAQRAAGDAAKAKELLARLKKTDPAALRWGRYAAAWTVLCDDLNVPGALGEIFKVEPKAATVEQAMEDLEGLVKIAVHTLGLDLPLAEARVSVPPEIAEWGKQRWEAKQAKDFAKADALRQELAARGWKSLDRKDGYDLAPE